MTETIREQIMAIRDTGLTNMFDVLMVAPNTGAGLYLCEGTC